MGVGWGGVGWVQSLPLGEWFTNFGPAAGQMWEVPRRDAPGVGLGWWRRQPAPGPKPRGAAGEEVRSPASFPRADSRKDCLNNSNDYSSNSRC